jgi:hypothetical protein
LRSTLIRIAALVFSGLYLVLLILTWMANASVADWGIIRGARWLEGPGRLVVLEVAADGPAARAGLAPTDVILAINGQALDEEFFSKWGQERRVGDQVKLEVRRGENVPSTERGSIQEITLTLAPRFSMPIFPVVLVIYTLISLLAVSVALLVLLSRPTDWAARLLALGMGAYSIALLLDSWAYQFYQLWVLQSFLYLFVFGSAALLHLFLIFPVSSPYLARLRQSGPQALRKFNVPLVLYGLPLALSLLLAQGSNVPVVQTLFLSFILLACAVVALVRGYGRVHTSSERAQLKWITFGLAFGVLGTAVIILSIFNLRFEVVTLSIAASGWVFFPISVGIAVLRHRLYDIDLVINRTLVYLPLTGILAGLFAASITLSQKLSIALTGQQSDAATILTTLIVVAAFTPVKDRLQAVVDRRFKEGSEAAKMLDAFAENVQSRVMLVEPRLITRRLLEEAVAALEASSGAAYMRSDGKPELVATVGNWDGNAKLSAPLCAGGKDFGVVSLGDRRKGSDYTVHDRQVLQQTAQVVALAIEQDNQADQGSV